MMDVETKDLIAPRRALKILTFVSRSGLYAGSRGTNELTLFFDKNGRRLYSRQECEALRDAYIKKGLAIRDKEDGADDYVEELV